MRGETEQRVREDRPRWLLAAIAAVLFCTAFALSHWVDTLWQQGDDAYITYQYARRLAAGEGFTFSPGAAPSYGSTTPLWTLILAAIARAGIPPHVAAPWLTWILHGATAVLVFLVGAAIGGLATALPAGAMAALSLATFFRAGGMETALVTALAAALAYVLLLGRRRWWPGVLLGLLLLTRPDMILLALVVFGGWTFTRRARREMLRPNLLAAVAMYLPWAVYALWTFHDLIPFSLRAKLAVEASGDMNLHSFRQWFLAGMPTAVFWSAVGACVVGAVVVWVRAPAFRPFVAWLPLYYWALPAAGASDFMWYYIPPLWVGFILLASGLQAIARAFPRRARAPGYAVLALAAVGGYALVSYNGLEPLLLPDNPYPQFHPMLAGKVAELAEPGDMVAAPEVGCIAYFTDCRILDIRGVTCPEVIVRARARNLGAMLRHWKPDFVVILGGDGEPTIEYAYTDRFRAPYWNGMDYVIWERTLEADDAAGGAAAAGQPLEPAKSLDRARQEVSPADSAKTPF